MLDNQFIGHNHLQPKLAPELQTCEEAAKDAINSIAERDIYTGSNVDIVSITAAGVSVKQEKIRGD